MKVKPLQKMAQAMKEEGTLVDEAQRTTANTIHAGIGVTRQGREG